jgi:hypothetical protein
MAPIKIHIKSSSADIAEQATAEKADSTTTDASAEADSTAIDTSEVPAPVCSSIKTDSSAVVPNTADSVMGASDAEDKDNTDVATTGVDDDKGTDSEVKNQAGQQQGTGPGSVNSELYEYEGDDVYYTNQTTKGNDIILPPLEN